MNYKERLLNELMDITIKIDRLRKFLHDKEFYLYSTSLEEKQLGAMEEYRLCLMQRILNLMK